MNSPTPMEAADVLATRLARIGKKYPLGADGPAMYIAAEVDSATIEHLATLRSAGASPEGDDKAREYAACDHVDFDSLPERHKDEYRALAREPTAPAHPDRAEVVFQMSEAERVAPLKELRINSNEATPAASGPGVVGEASKVVAEMRVWVDEGWELATPPLPDWTARLEAALAAPAAVPATAPSATAGLVNDRVRELISDYASCDPDATITYGGVCAALLAAAPAGPKDGGRGAVSLLRVRPTNCSACDGTGWNAEEGGPGKGASNDHPCVNGCRDPAYAVLAQKSPPEGAAMGREEVMEWERRYEISRAELRHEREKFERVFKVLMGIHGLTDPPTFLAPDGRTMKFVNPMAAEVLHELSNRIRAIPTAIDAALAATSAGENDRG